MEIKKFTLFLVILSANQAVSYAQDVVPQITESEKLAHYICAQSSEKMRTFQTMKGTLTCLEAETGKKKFWSRFQLKQPYFYETVGIDGVECGNGKTVWRYDPEKNTYFRERFENVNGDFPGLPGLELMFNHPIPDSMFYADEKVRYEMASFKGLACASVIVDIGSYGKDNKVVYVDKMIVYIDAKSKIPLGFFQELTGVKETFYYENLSFDEAIPSSMFEWKPPKSAVENR